MTDIIKLAQSGIYITDWVRMERTRYCLMFVKALVNGDNEVLLLVDTAASATIVTAALADRLRLPVADQTFVGHTVGDVNSFRYQKSVLDRLQVGDRVIENCPVLVSERSIYYPNSHYDACGITDIGGVLGADFLRRFVVSVDTVNSQMHFHLPAEKDEAQASEGVSVDFELKKFGVIVEVEVTDGLKANFLLDTGAAGSFFSTRLTELLDIKEDDRRTIPLRNARGIGGQMSQFDIVKHDSVFLSGLEVPTEFVMVRDLDYSAVFGDTRIDGLLGGNIFYNYQITLDYQNRKLSLNRVN